MRCSLFVPADTLPDRLRSRAYVPVEQQAVAAELAGFSAVWLTDQWISVPPRLPNALPLIRQLGVVTDRIDLGMILRLPPAHLRAALIRELIALDEFVAGRLRVALDLRGLNAGDHDLGLALLDTLAEPFGARRALNPARRLALIADENAALPAGLGGFGLLLAPGDPLHSRRLWLARYHDRREVRPGWVTRLLTVAPAADEAELSTLQRAGGAKQPLLSAATEAAIVGLPAQLVAQLAVAQIADGLDEVVCAILPASARADRLGSVVELLGREVVRHLQPSPTSTAAVRRVQPDL